MNLQDFLGDPIYYLLIAALVEINLYLASLIWEVGMINTIAVG